MKLSQLNDSMLADLSTEQVTSIVFGSLKDDGLSGIAAILLGGKPLVLRERAQTAAKLYHDGRVPCIIPTGGVQWETELGLISEADYMAHLLKEYKVPDDAILLENQAKTTRENMIYGTLLLEKTFHPRGKYRLYIVSSPAHLRRALALAQLYLPRNALISGCPAQSNKGAADNWTLDDEQVARVYRELGLIKKTIDHGDMEDIEF